MSHLLWFIHILGVALWLGGLTTVGLILRFIRRESDSVKLQVLPVIVRNATRITHIGAGLLLLGGIPMLFMISHAKLAQFWVQYMGGVGILVILISLSMLSAARKGITSSPSNITLALQSYLRWLYVILTLSLSVLVVVAFRL